MKAFLKVFIFSVSMHIGFAPYLSHSAEITEKEKETNIPLALAFIEKYNDGENIANLGYQEAMSTKTFGTLVKNVGRPKAVEIIKQEIDKLIPSYQKQWNLQLASGYVRFLNREQLHSMLVDGGKSKTFVYIASIQTEMNKFTQLKVRPVMAELVSRAMIAAEKHVVK